MGKLESHRKYSGNVTLRHPAWSDIFLQNILLRAVQQDICYVYQLTSVLLKYHSSATRHIRRQPSA